MWGKSSLTVVKKIIVNNFSEQNDYVQKIILLALPKQQFCCKADDYYPL